LLVKVKAKIHRSHDRVFNGLVIGIYTMWFILLFHHSVCMDVAT
jgi:hypothetical protein